MVTDNATDRRALRGIIFDLDGTLVDSALDFEAIRRDMGLPTSSLILETLDRTPSGTEKHRMLDILRHHELQAAHRAVLYEGVAEFLEWIDSRQLHRGILTRNSRESTAIVLERLNLQFSCVLTREDAPPKPDPEGLLSICRSWQLPPDEVLFCGDYLFDLQAGTRAGMRTILFAPEELPEFAGLADLVLRDFRDAQELIGEQFHVGERT